MDINSLVDKLSAMISPVVEELGYELYHIELVKQDGEYYLRIYIDKTEGITLDDCEKVSRSVSNLLDEKDPIPVSYYLEVSSPGIFRTLYSDKHFNRYIGSRVKIKLNSLFNGKKIYEGKLSSFSNENITLSFGNEDVIIPREKISSVTLNGEL